MTFQKHGNYFSTSFVFFNLAEKASSASHGNFDDHFLEDCIDNLSHNGDPAFSSVSVIC